jgi:hypothetical protein
VVLEGLSVGAGLEDSAGFESAAGFDSVAGLASPELSDAGFSVEPDALLGA